MVRNFEGRELTTEAKIAVAGQNEEAHNTRQAKREKNKKEAKRLRDQHQENFQFNITKDQMEIVKEFTHLFNVPFIYDRHKNKIFCSCGKWINVKKDRRGRRTIGCKECGYKLASRSLPRLVEKFIINQSPQMEKTWETRMDELDGQNKDQPVESKDEI